ncbi:thiamine pyrophosphate-binding protein [Porticoccaceae bacterium]|nr:thiamine pyrophosphate-binding protein [Porticoccaceae bacterium]
MKRKVRDIVANILQDQGVKHIFGHTGDNILAMWQSIKNTTINPIFNKTEFGAAFMADGYSRTTEKLSVILTTGGPGATNLATPFATAYLDSIPLLAISGATVTSDVGKNAFQEGTGRGRSIEQRLCLKAVCKSAMLASSPEAVEAMLLDGIREACTGRPGPVYIEVPSDFWDIKVNSNYKPNHLYRNPTLPEVNHIESQIIINQLYKSSHPLMMVGEGVSENNIGDTLMQCIDTLQIPFCASPLGKNYVDEFHDLHLGSGYESKDVHFYLEKCDYLLLLGVRLQPDFLKDKSLSSITLVQVDNDPLEIGRSFPVNFSAVGSIASFLKKIPKNAHKRSTELSQYLSSINNRHIQPKQSPLMGLNPIEISQTVMELAPKNTIIVCDTGYTKARIVHQYKTHLEQKILLSDRNGCMGYSIPAAIGASIGSDKLVICFCGDGGFQMGLNELGVVMNYGLKIIFIIENNGGCGSISDYNFATYGNRYLSNFKNPNFDMLAKSYDLDSFVARDINQFRSHFLKSLENTFSSLIHAHLK